MSVTLLTDADSFRDFSGIALDDLSESEADVLITQVSAAVASYIGQDVSALLDGSSVVLEDVRLAVNAMVAHWYHGRGGAGRGAGGEVDRGGSFMMPTATMQLLTPYKIISFGNDEVEE